MTTENPHTFPHHQPGGSARDCHRHGALGQCPVHRRHASESEAAEQTSTEATEQEAENEAETEEDEEVAVPVEVAEVTTGAITSYISATANLVAEDQVKVLSEAEGRVERLLVEEGDMVSTRARCSRFWFRTRPRSP